MSITFQDVWLESQQILNSHPTEANSPPQVAIVITNWNGRQFLTACLTSILVQDFQDFEVWLVDNASTDDSVELVRSHFPRVKVIENKANVGLCAANNCGILATEAEFVLILNNDTELEPDCLGHLVAAMQVDSQLGMCASKMRLTDRRDMIESAGIVIDRAGIPWGLAGGTLDRGGESKPSPVFGACGGAALYRRSMLLEIGLFDEDLFVYFEDADVAWRGQWAGWKCVYVPAAVVYHAHSATIKEGSPFKTRLLGRNKVWLIAKNYPWPHLLWYAPLILLYELMAIGYLIITGRGRDALRGRWEGLTRLTSALTKRRQLVKRVSAGAMLARLQPVENPLRLWRRHLSLFNTVGSHYKKAATR